MTGLVEEDSLGKKASVLQHDSLTVGQAVLQSVSLLWNGG